MGDLQGKSRLPLLILVLAAPDCAVLRSDRWEKDVAFPLSL